MLIVAISAFASLWWWICSNFWRWGKVTQARGTRYFYSQLLNPCKWVNCSLSAVVIGSNTRIHSLSGESCFPWTLTKSLAFNGYLGYKCPFLCFLMLGFLIGGTVKVQASGGCTCIRKLCISVFSLDKLLCAMGSAGPDSSFTPGKVWYLHLLSWAHFRGIFSCCFSQEILSFFLLFPYLQLEEIQTGGECRQETKYCRWCTKIPL